MDNPLLYKSTVVFTKDTFPGGLQRPHNTQAGTFARIEIIRGSLTLEILTAELKTETTDTYNVLRQPPLLFPQQWHQVGNLSADFIGKINFYCRTEDFAAKKYGFAAAHSEIVKLTTLTTPGKTLDLGCGQGRNSIYLALKGYQVTAVDSAAAKINRLWLLAAENNWSNLQTAVYDINRADIKDSYELIIATVVLMFLDPARIPAVITNMQEQTKKHGINLIVAAVDTADFYTGDLPFKFKLQPGELAAYYRSWTIINYKEEVGELHRTDKDGKRRQLCFATLTAQKK